jgi:molecular chaperone HscA
MVAGAARIRVSFEVDADGLLQVSAREQASNVEASVSVKPSYGLADEDIARMLTESFTTAEADMHERSLREAQVDADRMLLATRAALEVDGDLLEDGERASVEASMDRLRALREGREADAIAAGVEELAKQTEAFAAARMNRGIRRALAGRRIEDV